jgi:hypothetical protein
MGYMSCRCGALYPSDNGESKLKKPENYVLEFSE